MWAVKFSICCLWVCFTNITLMTARSKCLSGAHDFVDLMLSSSSSHMTCSLLTGSTHLLHVLPCMWHRWCAISIVPNSLSSTVLLEEGWVCKASLSLPISKAGGLSRVFVSVPAESSSLSSMKARASHLWAPQWLPNLVSHTAVWAFCLSHPQVHGQALLNKC